MNGRQVALPGAGAWAKWLDHAVAAGELLGPVPAGSLVVRAERVSIEAKIISAIQSKRVIVIGYSGSRREVEPHLLGVNAKGNKCLSAFQTAGGSAASWRAFLIEKITSVELLDDQFDVRKGYNPNDSTMSVIIERV